MKANPTIATLAPGDLATKRPALVVTMILVLWAVYTLIEAFFQAGQLHPVLATVLDFIPGLFGIGLLLAAGLAVEDCFLKFTLPSKAGLAVLFLLSPLFAPVLLPAVWVGWRPVIALALNPLGAISQELFFRCALLPALLLILRDRQALAILLHAVLFGLWHTGPLVSGAPWYGIVSVMVVPFLFGLGWGWQTARDRTVAWVMVYHVILLFISSFFTWG